MPINGRKLHGRRLIAEPLERREMLAADVLVSQNFASPEDVNADGVLAPGDALLVVNELNSISAAEGEASAWYPDVSGDGVVSPRDVLGIINRLNAGPGAPSGASLESRVASAREALESGELPGDIAVAEAEDLLATLEAGGRPEVGERLISGRIVDLSLAADIVDRVAQIGDIGPRAADILNDVGDFLRSVDDQEPLLDQITDLLSDLGVHVDPVRQRIDEVVGIIEDSTRGDAEDAARDLLVELRSTLAENSDKVRDALTDVRDHVRERPVGDHYPRLRESLRDGLTPIQDFLENLEERLDFRELGEGLESFIERLSGVTVPLSDILPNFFDRVDNGARDRLFADHSRGSIFS